MLPAILGVFVLAAVVATAAWLSFRPADGPPVTPPEGDREVVSGPRPSLPDDGNGPTVEPPSTVPRIPEPEDLTLRTIELLVAEKETERAILALGPHLQKKDPEAKAWRLRGQAYLDRESWRLAEKDFAHALEREGEDPTAIALDGRAEALIHLRKTAAARKLLDRSLAIEPERARVHALRALSYLKDGDGKAARASLDEALRLDPDDPLARGLLKRVGDAPR